VRRFRANAKLISSTLENYNSLGGAIDIGAILLTKEMTLIGVSNQEYRDSIYNLLRYVKITIRSNCGCFSRIGTCSPSMASDIREFATMECCFSNPLEGNCRLMELRLRKNIICKYRFATCYFGVELFLKNPLI
jgi:hypothetical protein